MDLDEWPLVGIGHLVLEDFDRRAIALGLQHHRARRFTGNPHLPRKDRDPVVEGATDGPSADPDRHISGGMTGYPGQQGRLLPAKPLGPERATPVAPQAEKGRGLRAWVVLPRSRDEVDVVVSQRGVTVSELDKTGPCAFAG